MTTATPKLREDLEARETEEAGIKYYDVDDPRSGHSLRMYEHEWMIALCMDGNASLEEVCAFAGENFGFQPTPADLTEYATTLSTLGFFDEAWQPAHASEPARAKAGARSGDETSFADMEIEHAPPVAVAPPVIAAPPRPPARPTPPPSLVDASDRTPPPSMSAPRAVANADDITSRREAPSSPPQRRQVDTQETTPPSVPRVEAEAPRLSEPALARVSQKPGKSSSGVIWGVVLAALLCAGAGAYVLVIGPALAPAHVKVQAVSAARDVVRTYEPTGKVERSAPLTLSFAEEGQVGDVVPAGTETKPGMTLASLETTPAIEKDLGDVTDREAYYENQVKKLTAKGKAKEAKAAQAKVEEKAKLRAELEELLGKSRIVSKVASTVGEVLVTAGSAVAAGAPVVKLVDKRTLVEIKLGDADAKTLKVGSTVTVTQAESKGAITAEAKVTGVDAGTVKLELVDDAGGAIKVGDAVAIVRSKLAGVIKVPVAAVTKSQGGADQIYILIGDRIAARLVTLATERTATELFVSNGLVGGDRIIVGSAAPLQDGHKAVIDP